MTNIRALIGGLGNDTLLGDAQDNILRGGPGNDVLNGRSGVDTLDESNATANLIVNLPAGTMSGIGADILSNIENILTGSGNDTLISDGADNLLNGAAGDDTYAFSDNWGHDTILDSNGNDSFNFSAVTAGTNFTISTTISATDGVNTLAYGNTDIETLRGGSGGDTFVVTEGNVYNGLVDGNGGKDTLNYAAYTHPVSIQLSGTGTLDGFTGTGSGLAGSFTNVDAVIGGTATDILTGTDIDTTWSFTGTSSQMNVSTNTLSFSGFESLVGGSGFDTFRFQNAATYTGLLNGSGNTDAFDFSGYGSAVTLNLQSRTVSGVNGTFTSIELITGSSHTDSIVGMDAGSTFYVNGNRIGTVDGWFGFTQIEQLLGGAGPDTLDYSAYTGPAAFDLSAYNAKGFAGSETNSALAFFNIDTLVGSSFGDSLQGLSTNSTWSVTGAAQGNYVSSGGGLTFVSIEKLIGENGSDTLSYASYLGAIAVMLVGAGGLGGFTGLATGLTGFQNIDILLGGSGADSLTGPDASTVWSFTTVSYQLSALGSSFSFSAVEKLIGGILADTFTFSSSASFPGSIDGGTGRDVFDFSAGTNPVSVNLSAIGSLDGFAGSVLGRLGSFDNADAVIGSGSSHDTFTGADLNATFEMDGSERYLYAGHALELFGLENLLGGSRDDTFVFSGTSIWPNWVKGGMGMDTLDFSVYGSAIKAYLYNGDFDGFFGDITRLTDNIYTLFAFTGIDRIIATPATGATGDQLYGAPYISGDWLLTGINGQNSQYTETDSGASLNFVNFDRLYGSEYADSFTIEGAQTARLFGGPGHDNFVMLQNASLTGSIDGGGGNNTLDYSYWTTPVSINLENFTATNLIGNLVGIVKIIGGSNNDVLTGNMGDNILVGNGGNDLLTGGSGDDTYIFGDNFGTDTLADLSGDEILDFSAVPSSLSFNLPNFTVSGAAGTVSYGSNGIEYFIGGTAVDRFIFTGSYTLPSSGTLDGGTGVDTLDYSLYNSAVSIDFLRGLASATSGISQIEDVVGSAYMDTLDFTAATNNYRFDLGASGLTAVDLTSGAVYSARGMEHLLAGAGNDTFAFGANGSLAGGGPGTFIDGGPGNNTLDYNNYGVATYVNLFTKAATGVNTTAGIPQPNGIDHIQNVIGGTVGNEIWGDNGDNVLISGSTNDNLHGLGGNDTYIFHDLWGLDTVFEDAGGGVDTLNFSAVTASLIFTFGAGSVTISDGLGNQVTHNGTFVENFIGTNQNDLFIFQNNAVSGGMLDGRGGYDTLDYSAYTTARHVTLTGPGTTTGFNGTEASGNFSNIEKLVGTTLVDSLTGCNTAADWRLDSAPQYASVNTLDYTSFENLTGGTNVDTFHLSASSIFNMIDGGTGADVLDLSAFLSARNVTLSGNGATDGMNGSVSGLAGTFANINQVTGTTSTDTLTGSTGAETFNISGTGVGIVNGRLAFASFENLAGGGGSDTLSYAGYASPVTVDLQTNAATGILSFTGFGILIGSSNSDTVLGTTGGDTFSMTPGGFTAGGLNFNSFEKLDALGGTDTLTYAAYGSAVTIDLQNSTATGLVSFVGFENIVGSAVSDTLRGRNTGSTYQITGAGIFKVDGLNFTSFENIQAGLGVDTLDYGLYAPVPVFVTIGGAASGLASYSGFEAVNGSSSNDTANGTAGADTFTMTGISAFQTEGMSFTSFEIIDGKAGADTVDYRLYPSTVTVNLLAGTAAGVVSISNVENITGSPYNDTLTGDNNASIINPFDGLDTLTGNGGADTFIFPTGVFFQSVDGGAGIDLLDFSSHNVSLNVILSSTAAAGFAGMVNTHPFSNMDGVTGGTANDSLTGLNAGTTWTFNGLNSQLTTSGNTLTFAEFETLVGGTSADTFTFNGTAVYNGSINGGAGTDILNYVAYTVPASIDLSTQTATGITGTFTNIETFTGSSNLDSLVGTSGDDTFRMTSAGKFTLGLLSFTSFENLDGGAGTDMLDYSTYATAVTVDLEAHAVSGLTSFTGFEAINGSTLNDTVMGTSAADTFAVTDAGAFQTAGISFTSFQVINGAAGADTLDYTGYPSGVTVNLAAGVATGFTSISSIENLIGSAFNDSLTGDANGNAITGGAGNDTLTGGAGNDTYLFADNFGVDSVVELALGGTDTLDFSAATLGLTVNLSTSGVVINQGANRVTYNGTNLEGLTGSGANDTFKFAAGASFPGTLNGGSGTDVLDYSAYSVGVNVDLSAGTATGAVSIANFENIIGSAFADTLSGGNGANVITGGAGNDTLNGRQGDDSYVFAPGYGLDTIIETALGGDDTFDFTALTSTATIRVVGNVLTVSNGTSNATHTGLFIEHILTGTANNNLDLSGDSTIHHVLLTATGTLGGFMGVVDGMMDFDNVDNILDSPLAGDSLTGLDMASLWTLGLSSTYTALSCTLTFTSFESLYGGNAADTFSVSAGASFAGSITGGAGADTLTYAAWNAPVALNFGANSATGLNGFQNIENFAGGSASDTLTGTGGIDLFTVNAANGGTFNGLTFSSFENLDGAAGADTFTFTTSGSIGGILNGGAGSDTLDFSAVTASRNVTLTGADSNGFNGTQAVIAGGFMGVDVLLGSSSPDSLTGANSNAGWTLDTPNSQLTASFQGLAFSGFESLIGGSASDTFTFNGSAAFTGTLNGGAGTNWLDYSAYGSAVTVTPSTATITALTETFSNIAGLHGSTYNDTVVGRASGSTFHINSINSGDVDGFAFTSAEHLLGGSGVDMVNTSAYANPVSVTLTGAGAVDGFSGTCDSLSVGFENINVLVGSAALDTLTGPNAAADWTLTATNSQLSALSSSLSFTGFENIIGGSSSDIFQVTEGQTFAGSVNGSAGDDTLDYSLYSTALSVSLTGLGWIDGFNGTATGLTGGFKNMNTILGGSNFDSLKGMDGDSLWSLATPGSSYTTLATTLNFANFNALIGGSGNDTFRFAVGGSLNGNIVGGSGSDTLDYHLFDSAVTVNLSTNSATAVTGTVTGVENVTGSDFNDNLTGDANANILNGGKGNDTLQGGGGNDSYVFDDGWGADFVTDTSGSDTLDFTTVTTNLDVNLAGSSITSGANTVNGFTGIDKIFGGAGNDLFYIDGTQNYSLGGGGGVDEFRFTNNGTLTGTLDGGAGVDTLDYSLDSATILTGRSFTLTGQGLQDGFNGYEATTIAAGFSNVDEIMGGMYKDTLEGMNVDATFTIHPSGSGVDYQVGAHTLVTTSLENLVGGDLNDNFVFEDQGSLPGLANSIDGKAGLDTLDYTTYTTPVAVYLSGGIATGVADGVSGIERVLGSPAGSIIHGDDNDNILVGFSGNDEIYGYGGNDVLAGMGGDDLLDGGLGIDTVDYSGNFVSGVAVSLVTNTADSLESGHDILVSIENIMGTDFADVLTGDGNANQITGRTGNDTLTGGAGADTYYFADNWGVDTVNDASGTDTFDFSAATLAVIFNLQSTSLTVTSGANSVMNTPAQIEHLTGGAGNDTFIIGDGAVSDGRLDGRGGTDKLDLSAYTTARNVSLSDYGGFDGFNGSEAAIPLGFNNFEQITAGSAIDTLAGLSFNSAWTLAALDSTYSAGGRALTLISFETFVGGSASDTFTVTSGAHTAEIRAGAGDDTLVMLDGASISGMFDGQGDNDTLDYRAYTTTLNFTLTALGSTDGFDGTEVTFGGFANLQTILGGAAVDSLHGMNILSVFDIQNGLDTYTTGSTSLSFNFLENLYGGTQTDTFHFFGTHTGLVDGGAGYDVLDFSAYTDASTFGLTSADADGFDGTTAAVTNGFFNMDYLLGYNGSGLDSLQGLDSVSTWTLNLSAQKSIYSASGFALDFSYIDSLLGGSAADTFRFNNDAFLGGTISGGAGYDILDWSAYTTARGVTLTSPSGADGFAGSEASIAGDFTLINQVDGSGAADTLSGLNVNSVYNLTASGTGNYFSSNTLDFVSFENLHVGTGVDLLNYSAYGSGVTVNLSTGAATGLVGVTGFENLTGSSFSDHLTGNNNNNIITGLAGDDGLNGLDGNDTYIFGAGWGNDTLTDPAGMDTIDFSALTTALTFNVNSSTLMVTGSGTLSTGLGVVESIISGTGTDTLDSSAASSPAHVTLTSVGTLDGFKGSDSGLTFDNINVITGSPFADDLTGLAAGGAFTVSAAGAGEYAGASRILSFSGLETLNGLAGYDTLSFTIPAAVTLTSANANGFSGTSAFLAFTGIDGLTGSAGTDTLSGMNATATWELDGSNRYLTGGFALDWVGFENLSGGSGADTFLVSAAQTETLDGGAGRDTLSYAGNASAINVTLSGLGTTDGFNGNGTGGYTFTNLDVLIGSPFNDTLTGAALAATFELDGTDRYIVGLNDLEFSDIDRLIGGAQNDTFKISVPTSCSLDGGAGADTLDYSSYGSGVTANLATGIATSLGSLTAIENLIGSSFADNLTGDANANRFTGGPGNDTLNGGAGNDTYLFADNWGSDTLVDSAGTDTIDFSALTGASTITLSPTALNGSGSGTLTAAAGLMEAFVGGAGTDTLDLSAYNTSLTMTLSAHGALDGFNGAMTSLVFNFANLNRIVSGSGLDTLVGPNVAASFNLTANNAGNVDNLLTFSAIENLTGGSANDTFLLWNTATISGRLSGGAGNDTIDYSHYGSSVSVNLSAGTATGTSGINTIENFIGSPFGNVIYGDESGNVLIGTNAFDIIYGLGGDDVLIGLGGNDILDGGPGNDTVDYSANISAGINANLVSNTVTSPESGSDTLVSIENGIGTNFADTITGNAFANRITGGSGNDILDGGGGGNDVYLFGDNWGTDTLTDSAGNDTLDFSALTGLASFKPQPASLMVTGSGTLTVGGQVIETLIGSSVGSTLDLSAYSLGQNPSLTGLGTSAGMRGLFGGLTFDNMNAIIGGSGFDTLTSASITAAWQVTNSGLVYTSAGHSMTLSAIENITGGAGADTIDYSGYTLAGGATVNLQTRTATGLTGVFSGIESLTGSIHIDTLMGIDAGATFNLTGAGNGIVGAYSFSSFEDLTGGSGVDTLNYSGYASAVTVNLSTGTASGLNHVAGFENLTGSAFNDTLTGDSGANLLNGGGGNDTLNGGNGNDTYVFNANWGQDTVSDTAGMDTITFGGLSTAMSTNLNVGGFIITDGVNSLSHTGYGIENLITGSADDVFHLNAPVAVNLNGGAGTNTLDFSGYGASVTADLGSGTFTGLSGSITSITSFMGTALTDILVGTAGIDTFRITGANSGSLAGTTFTSFETLDGAAGNDIFAFQPGGSLSGGLLGGPGSDTLTYAAYASPVALDLETASATGLASFSGLESVIGSSAGDMLLGRNAGSSFAVTATNSGAVDGLAFTAFENLAGRIGADSFAFTAGGALTGSLNGGLGTDTLDFSSIGSVRNVTLTSAGSQDGMAGTVGVIAGGFNNINNLVGSSASDTLTGFNSAAIWTLNPVNSAYTAQSASVSFSGFEKLQGGAAADTFRINGLLAFNLDGGAGDDTFAFSGTSSTTNLNGLVVGGAGMDLPGLQCFRQCGQCCLFNRLRHLASQWGDWFVQRD